MGLYLIGAIEGMKSSDALIKEISSSFGTTPGMEEVGRSLELESRRPG